MPRNKGDAALPAKHASMHSNAGCNHVSGWKWKHAHFWCLIQRLRRHVSMHLTFIRSKKCRLSFRKKKDLRSGHKNLPHDCVLSWIWERHQDSFHQQIHSFIKHIKQLKCLFVCSYMFRSNWTILRERMPSLAKATILWNWSVKNTSLYDMRRCGN